MKSFAIDKRLWIRRAFLILLDIILINSSAFLAILVRFDFRFNQVPLIYYDNVLKYSLINCITTILIFWLFRIYSSLWQYAGIDEMVNILFACFTSGCAQFIGMYFIFQLHVPRSYFPLSMIFLIITVSASRFLYRYARKVSYHYRPIYKSRIMIIGAGSAANTIIKEIRTSSYVEGKVICAIDDNKEKQGKYIQGVKIVGDRSKIIESVAKYQITDIFIAMPSTPRVEVKQIIDICKNTNCKLKILPGVYQLINEEVSVTRLRTVEIDDLLGREPVKINLAEIMDYVSDKVVMVTGGGGSIGSELCRQIAVYNPSKLIIIDIYENNVYHIQQELKIKYPNLDLVVLIASIRNTNRMNHIFEVYRPNLVFHAAAHKHVPLMEASPNEAIKNNVFGTYKLAQAADRYGVDKFILISTDKAVNPTSIMGASKRICEMIIQTINKYSKTDFVAVRFGNVLGSNGSVIPLFKEQILRGGPVTVTHPDIIRYFMTIPEAVSLVLQAGAYANGGEIFILDMGEPVKIAELAENLIRLSGYTPGKDIAIEYTGLRPGEKLFEELLMDEEGLQDTDNKLIRIAKPIEIDEEAFMKGLENLSEASKNEVEDIRPLVKNIVPTYQYTNHSNND
jgi:FlaA1/EpsC-like NDP-sugar epimerase